MNPILRASFAAIALALFGCGSSTPPPTDASKASSSSAEAPAETPPESSSENAEESTSAGPVDKKATETNARIIEVSPKSEGKPYANAKIVFENPTTHVCTISAYTLTWGGGKKRIEKAFTVPAGESRQRSVRANPNDGDLASLTRESAKVEIQTNCAP